MFCPNCGKEVQDGAAFCGSCGYRIAGDGGEPVQRKASNPKRIFIIVAVVVVILLAVLIIRSVLGSKGGDTPRGGAETGSTMSSKDEGGFNSYEDVVDSYFSAAFDNDVEGVINCFPKQMHKSLKDYYNMYRSGDYFGPQQIFSFLDKGIETPEGEDGEDKYTYTMGGLVDLSSDEISELESKYNIIFEEIYIAETSYDHKYLEPLYKDGYITETIPANLKVAKIGKKWFLIEATDDWR